jgi:proteasome accessory factor C
MDKFDRIQQLHRLLCSHRYPIAISKISEKLECTNKTSKIAIDLLRDQLHAPLVYCPQSKGWQYDNDADAFELPGLWLTAEELHKGLLGKEINVVQHQVEKLLKVKGVNIDEFNKVIKYISISKQSVISQHFSTIIDALIHNKQLHIHYIDYSGKITQRNISPQTLIHYQENWYLDAWCHKREALRSFMLPRITKVIKVKDKAKRLPAAGLKEHYQSSYGIFAGKPKHTAILKFYPPVTREAASIQWHPDQENEWQGDNYHVTIPYNDDRELVRDILKYGNNVEVIKPANLKNKIKRIAQSVVGIYE